MQMVINIDKDVYTALHGKNTKVISMLDILNAIFHGTVLPENPTNGDMIKAMFPNIDTSFSNIIDLNLWWNAPYKGGKECR